MKPFQYVRDVREREDLQIGKEVYRRKEVSLTCKYRMQPKYVIEDYLNKGRHAIVIIHCLLLFQFARNK